MFGLMRARKCGMTDAEKHFRRLNYCGTCKTIGSLYGNKARLLLNHDTVFLAETLSALGGETPSDWGKPYQSFNCLSLPKSEMPIALQFAATANLVLTEFKLADHVADERKRRYKLAQKTFSSEFQTAENLLKDWNFPLREIRTLLDSQNRRETTEKSLDEFAFPTAETTGIFFREGAKRIGKNEFENHAYELGFAFGKLVYLLDAFEDYAQDFRDGKFNAFRAAFGLTEEKLSPVSKRKIAGVLRETESAIAAKISELPIAESQKTLFVSRLADNLRRKIKTELPVIKTKNVCAPRPKVSFRQRWLNATEKAKNLAFAYRWQMPLVFLFVFAFALVAPAQTREAKSARECFDLSFSLITLGAIFGAVPAFPKTVLMQQFPEETVEEKVERKKSWCDYCDCHSGCCDGCCCCCDNCGGDGCCCDCSCD